MSEDEEKKETKRDILVVSQLPQIPTNVGNDGKGKEFDLITSEDALTEMLKILRRVEKGVLG